MWPAVAFFQRVLELARVERLLSDEHFSVDGTLIQAWAGQKSFVRKGTTPPPPDDPGNPTVNFHGEKRSNATHASITDSDALLFKKAKGHEAKLSYLGHMRIENRHGLVVNSRLTQATGRAEWEAAWAMAKQIPGRRAQLAVREALVRTRTRYISVIRAVLRRDGVRVPSGGAATFGPRVQALALSATQHRLIAPLLALLWSLNQQLAVLETQLARQVAGHAAGRRLCTVPGVGPVTAAAVVATLEYVGRFASAD